MILTFELTPDQDELEIFADIEGLDYIIQKLDSLRTNIELGHSHIHLMTEDWGGHELSNTLMHNDNALLNHVKIIVFSNKQSVE